VLDKRIDLFKTPPVEKNFQSFARREFSFRVLIGDSLLSPAKKCLLLSLAEPGDAFRRLSFCHCYVFP
jgi:hypothetical protein